MSVQGAKNVIGGGLLVMGLGQHFHETSCQKLRPVVEAVSGCSRSSIEISFICIGVMITFLGLHKWISAAIKQL